MIILLIILAWLACGFLAIYLDNKINNVEWTLGETLGASLLGLLGLLMFIVSELIEKRSNFWNKKIFKSK